VTELLQTIISKWNSAELHAEYHFMWRLSVAASCRLAYRINVAHPTDSPMCGELPVASDRLNLKG